MNPDNNAQEQSIVITRDQAMSPHVDDMLNRQKSMMGDKNYTVHRDSKWYLKNWFLFGLAGALAALVMWAVMEPYYNDFCFIQGEITDLDLSERAPKTVNFGLQTLSIDENAQGWINIRDRKIWLSLSIQKFSDGQSEPLYPEDLGVGREVGVYLMFHQASGDEGVAIASFVDPSPSRPAPASALMDPHQLSFRSSIFGFILFPLMAGVIGLAIGAVEGIVCRHPSRAFSAGIIGMLVGIFGGLIANIPAGLLYEFMSTMALGKVEADSSLSGMGFFLQMVGRSMAWAVAGVAMGLGQGIAMRSSRLLLYGALGGIIGGLVGGALFDPIDLVFIRADTPSAHWSRMIGFGVVGLSVGTMIGIVQLMARDAWLRMTQGPLAGKEFLFFKDKMIIGSSPKCELFLFNDDLVKDQHAILRKSGDSFEIESQDMNSPVTLNSRTVKRSRLNNGDRITIGKTAFVFHVKQG